MSGTPIAISAGERVPVADRVAQPALDAEHRSEILSAGNQSGCRRESRAMHGDHGAGGADRAGDRSQALAPADQERRGVKTPT